MKQERKDEITADKNRIQGHLRLAASMPIATSSVVSVASEVAECQENCYKISPRINIPDANCKQKIKCEENNGKTVVLSNQHPSSSDACATITKWLMRFHTVLVFFTIISKFPFKFFFYR